CQGARRDYKEANDNLTTTAPHFCIYFGLFSQSDNLIGEMKTFSLGQFRSTTGQIVPILRNEEFPQKTGGYEQQNQTT
ncbi:MAG: hypothetical protein ACPGVJ_06335, partial [Mangrovicoccus sp.]